MTAPSTATPSAPDHRDPAVHPVTPDGLQWLEGELTRWQSEGLLGPDAALAIRGRYVASRRFTLSRIVLTLGACFFGLGRSGWSRQPRRHGAARALPADGRHLARPGRRVRAAGRPPLAGW